MYIYWGSLTYVINAFKKPLHKLHFTKSIQEPVASI